MTPLSRADDTSHKAFSMNQAGRKMVSGRPSAMSAFSIIVRWESRLS
jgi:hypothetical protein